LDSVAAFNLQPILVKGLASVAINKRIENKETHAMSGPSMIADTTPKLMIKAEFYNHQIIPFH
jgi:hypothetical protein